MPTTQHLNLKGDFNALFSLHFYQLYPRRNGDLEIDLTSISFVKAFEINAGDRLASYSVMQDKHTLMSGSNRLTWNITTDNLNTTMGTRDHPV